MEILENRPAGSPAYLEVDLPSPPANLMEELGAMPRSRYADRCASG